MRSLVRLLVASLTLFWLSIPAVAQPPGGLGTFIVASCGTLPTAYTAGQFNRAIVMDVNGSLCSSVSVSASITGFAPSTTGTPISVTSSAGGVTGTLPAGTVVVASNVGTTNLAYCKLGASATTADQPIAPNGGWFPFTVGAATQLTCITSTSTTTVNMVGGSGLPTGTGGGGGGSSGGAITIASGAVSSGAYSSGSIASGAYASGAFASGAFASGSVASGAFASGSLATGSMVDFLTTRGTKAPGTAAANSLLTGCVYTAAGITLTDGQQAACQATSTGGVLVSVANVNTNGQATMANSSPVVIASNQSAVPVSVASGGIASGAVASGAYASGSLASGAVVDITNMSVATGSAPPSKAIYLGANSSGATGGQVRGIITCDLHAKYDASDNGSKTLVTGVSGRKVYICGYIMATGGTATNLKLREGSDADCASNAADLTPAYQLVANDKIGANSAFWNGLAVSTVAYYVCINASAGNAHQSEIWYTIL